MDTSGSFIWNVSASIFGGTAVLLGAFLLHRDTVINTLKNPDLWAALLILLGLMIIVIWHYLKPMDPKMSENKYYWKKKERKRARNLEKEAKQAKEKDKARYESIYTPKLSLRAGLFEFRAKLAWGRSIRHRHKSAWFYVIAGEKREIASNWSKAAWDFHFAAHGFRELGEYWQAGLRYGESAKCFKQAPDCKTDAIRAYKRGIASYCQIGEHEEAEKLNEELREPKLASIQE